VTLVEHDALTLARLVREREVSCVEVMQAHLDRIAEVNPRLNAIVARLDSGVDLLFAGQPNDFAVLVSSAEGVPAGRTPPVRIELVASDHFSYFSTEEGLRAVTAALRAD